MQCLFSRLGAGMPPSFLNTVATLLIVTLLIVALLIV